MRLHIPEGKRPLPVAKYARWLLAIWVLFGLLLSMAAYFTPLERKQEARVLEGAREMLGTGWRGWMVPHENGRVRLQKPPVAYWVSAASFAAFGVGVFAGRLPMVLATWLTIGLVWKIARDLFGARAALLAAGFCAGSFFTFRYGRLAETDAMSLPMLVLAVYAMIRAADESRARRFLWHHLAALMLGLVAMTKAPPAAVPAIVFLVALAGFKRRWGILWDFVRCGAPLTLALVAAPWWVFALRLPGGSVIGSEVSDLVTGRDHPGTFAFHLPFAFMLQASLPWAGFVVLAIVAGIAQWHRDDRVRAVLLWIAAILLSLMVTPQKQEHYALPLLPPAMILVGWMLDRALAGDDAQLRKTAVWVLGATAMAILIAAPVVLVAAHRTRARITSIDIGMFAVLMVAALLLFILYHRQGVQPAVVGASLVGSVVLCASIGLWGPSIDNRGMAAVARQIESRFGDGPYAFYPIPSIPLCFEMQRIIPLYAKSEDLQAAAAKGLVLINEEDDPKNPSAELRGFELKLEFVMKKKTIRVYQGNSTSAQTSG